MPSSNTAAGGFFVAPPVTPLATPRVAPHVTSSPLFTTTKNPIHVIHVECLICTKVLFKNVRQYVLYPPQMSQDACQLHTNEDPVTGALTSNDFLDKGFTKLICKCQSSTNQTDWIVDKSSGMIDMYGYKYAVTIGGLHGAKLVRVPVDTQDEPMNNPLLGGFGRPCDKKLSDMEDVTDSKMHCSTCNDTVYQCGTNYKKAEKLSKQGKCVMISH